MKKLLNISFIFIFLLLSFTFLASAEPIRLNVSQESVLISESGDYIVTGTWFSPHSNQDRNIIIGSDISVNLTIENVGISAIHMKTRPLDIGENSNVNLTLVGENIFVGSINNPGIKIPSGSNLNIRGGGKLIAVGNSAAPGIGGATRSMLVPGVACGNVTIENGTVIALSGSGSPGIGAPTGYPNHLFPGGNISIKGGTVYSLGYSIGDEATASAIGGSQLCSVDSIKISDGIVHAFSVEHDSSAVVAPALCSNLSAPPSTNIQISGSPTIITGNDPNVAVSKNSYNAERYVQLNYDGTDKSFIVYKVPDRCLKIGGNENRVGVYVDGPFDSSNGASVLDFVDINESVKFITPTDKHFVTWKQNADLSGPSVFPGDVLTKETLLYAKYSDTPVIPVRYVLGEGIEGTVPPEGEYIKGSTVTVAELPSGISNPGNKFVGWKDVSSGTVYAPGKSFTMPDRSVTLSAVWDAILYNVTYDLNGGSGANAPVQQAVPRGTVFVVADLPQGIKNPGKKFVGWKDVSSGKIYMPSDRYEVGYSDTVLQAQWELSAPVYPEKTYWFFIQNDDRAYWINATSTGGPVGSLRQACSEAAFEVNISDNGWLTTLMNLGAVETTNGTWTYWLTFNRADNEWVYSSTTIADMINEDYFAFVYGATDGMTYQPLTTPNAPAKDGFVFDGYYMDPEFENSYDFSVMPTEEAQLYVKWKTKNPDLPILNPGAETPSLIDVLLLLQYTAGVGMYKDKNDTDMINLGADLDQDGQINLSDVLLFLKRL